MMSRLSLAWRQLCPSQGVTSWLHLLPLVRASVSSSTEVQTDNRAAGQGEAAPP